MDSTNKILNTGLPGLAKMLGTICLVALTFIANAQQTASLQVKEGEIQVHKGLIFLNPGPPSLSGHDLEIIDNYNFEKFRKSDSRCKIQLVRGPLVELLSKNEIETAAKQNNIHPTPSTDNPTPSGLHEVILQLSIGLGYKQYQHTEVLHK